MKMTILERRKRSPRVPQVLGCLILVLSAAMLGRADEPYARSKDYDLEHSRIVLRFDLEHRKVIGEVTHTLTVLRDGTEKLSFDSAGLDIQSVTADKGVVRFLTAEETLVVTLGRPASAGEKLEVQINYEGKPTKGLYFILPDKDYPNRPKQIWTQGESQDTHYYLPTYDYPNARLTTETILTVPAGWLTIANGKLIGVKDAGNGLKTWTWRESQPSSTYLISVVAGEFVEVKDAWKNLPVTYYAPKDRGDRLTANYGHTPAMIELFSKKLGVDYPWEKYAQVMVDDFVAGGMENSSATTNTASSLRDPRLVPEYPTDEDPLISHELGHQWFGDLVTCKDWGNIWLNEGFATFMESVWLEAHFGKDVADYERWKDMREWFQMGNLFGKSIVRYDFDDSSEFDDNAYTKGGLVLYMLRQQLGDDAFYAGLKHYLEANRGKNVVTADLIAAIESATHTNEDQFFSQWVYGAGAPRLDLSYTYDEGKKQVALLVKQTHKRDGRVGLFRLPAEVEITNASGANSYSIVVSQESEVFTFPSASAPKLVLFDKGNQVLKSVEFKKDMKEWLYQLKNASEVADRADAAVALGKGNKEDQAAAALGDALRNDKNWGVKMVAAQALGELGSPAAAKQILEAVPGAKEPWVRSRAVQSLGYFKDNPAVTAKLEEIAREDSSYRARATALQAIGRLKTPGAYAALTAAVKSDSPDGILRNAGLHGLGWLGDDKAVALLRDWAAPGNDLKSREAAISSLTRLQKDNKEITSQIAGYLTESHFGIRTAAITALGARGDLSAIPALEALLKSDDLSIELAPMIKEQIEQLKNPSVKGGLHRKRGEDDVDWGGDTGATPEPDEGPRLSQVEQSLKEMNERLKKVEEKLSQASPKP